MNNEFRTEDQVAAQVRAIRANRSAAISTAFEARDEVDEKAVAAIRSIQAKRAAREDWGFEYVPTTVQEARAARELEDAKREEAAAASIRAIRARRLGMV